MTVDDRAEGREGRTAVRAVVRGVCAAWAAAHTPVDGVARWARAFAYAVPLVVLPSGLWRMVAVLLPGNEDAHGTGQLPSWLPLPVYATFLSVVSELLAFAAVGLIAGWGEVLPRWIPGLGGRRVPPLAAALPAALAAVVLTAVWTFTAVTMLSGHTLQGRPVPPDHPLKALHGWELGAFLLSYAPLLLWGPLLGALCFAYWRRRRSSASRPPALAAARAG